MYLCISYENHMVILVKQVLISTEIWKEKPKLKYFIYDFLEIFGFKRN